MWLPVLRRFRSRVTRSEFADNWQHFGYSQPKSSATSTLFLSVRKVCLGLTAAWLLGLVVPVAGQELNVEQEKIIQSERADGRHVSTRGLVQHMLRNAAPRLALDPEFTPEELERWRLRVRAKLRELLAFPEVPPQPAPRKLWAQDRDGYALEKWEIYPEPGSVVPYLLLIPDNVSAENPGPAVMCFPGSSGTKENLAGEPPLHPSFKTNGRSHDGWRHAERNQQAIQFAKAGFIAVAVDHPGNGELSDLAKHRGTTSDDRRTIARYLIDFGRNYVGFSTFQKMKILEWLRTQPFVDAERIAVGGHSLGAEPALAMAVLDPSISAMIWNDAIDPDILRARVRTKPNPRGLRPGATHLMHSIPGMWEWFDWPDLAAAMAPRPLIITEGGATRTLERIRKAYDIAGASENLSLHYFPKYSDPATRRDDEPIPEGLDDTQWYDYVNVDVPRHYFKAYLVVPWLADRFGMSDPGVVYPPAPPEAAEQLE